MADEEIFPLCLFEHMRQRIEVDGDGLLETFGNFKITRVAFDQCFNVFGECFHADFVGPVSLIFIIIVRFRFRV